MLFSVPAADHEHRTEADKVTHRLQLLQLFLQHQPVITGLYDRYPGLVVANDGRVYPLLESLVTIALRIAATAPYALFPH